MQRDIQRSIGLQRLQEVGIPEKSAASPSLALHTCTGSTWGGGLVPQLSTPSPVFPVINSTQVGEGMLQACTRQAGKSSSPPPFGAEFPPKYLPAYRIPPKGIPKNIYAGKPQFPPPTLPKPSLLGAATKALCKLTGT